MYGCIKERWLSKFLPGVDPLIHRCQTCSKENLRSYYWHAFSFGLIESREINRDVFERELKLLNGTIYLLWEQCNSPALKIEAGRLHQSTWHNADIYIFDATYSWTFAVTHEGWIYYISGDKVSLKRCSAAPGSQVDIPEGSVEK